MTRPVETLREELEKLINVNGNNERLAKQIVPIELQDSISTNVLDTEYDVLAIFEVAVAPGIGQLEKRIGMLERMRRIKFFVSACASLGAAIAAVSSFENSELLAAALAIIALLSELVSKFAIEEAGSGVGYNERKLFELRKKLEMVKLQLATLQQRVARQRNVMSLDKKGLKEFQDEVDAFAKHAADTISEMNMVNLI